MSEDEPLSASRYDSLAKIASGGMATVFVGALKGGVGLRHLVALKRPHQHLLDDPGFRQALLLEAQVASGIRHANVVSVREIERLGESLQLVMDYVEGASLGQLLVHAAKTGPAVPAPVALRIALDSCAGLEALHELTDDAGRKLGFVHRDVSPQNILVGLDGVARVTDFGLAKCAAASEQPTTKGTLKGKLGYMAPEYVRGKAVDARADVFAMGVVTWEALTGKRLFRGESEAETIERVLGAPVPPPSSVAPELGPEIDAVIVRALDRSPEARFQTIRAFADALVAAGRDRVAPATEVAAVVRASMGEELAARRRVVGERFATEVTVGESAVARATHGARASGGRPRRQPWRLIGVGLVVLLLGGAGAVAWPRAHRASPAVAASAPVQEVPAPSAIPSVAVVAPSAASASSGAATNVLLPSAPPAGGRPSKRHHSPTAPSRPDGPPAPRTPPPNPYATP